MLTNLHVKNLALIDEADVEFGPGLNILTGETGAGKSILMGSVNLALGKKMAKEMIREGEDSCLVELVFQVENPLIRERLREMDAETENGQLIISRRIRDGRSVSRINGETCTAAQIRKIAGLLLDIHGQHEHQSLLYPGRQLEILDAFGREEIAPLAEAVSLAYREYRKLRRELDGYGMDEGERAREAAFLEFEIAEIEEAGLREDEEEELERRYRRMANSRKIAETLTQVHRLTGYEQGAGDLTGRAVRELSEVSALDEELQAMADALADADSLLNDFNRSVSAFLSDFTFSQEEFYETEKRLDLLNHLKSKYGRTVADVLAYLEQQKEKLEKLRNFEEEKAGLEAQLRAAEEKLEKAADALSEKRKKYGAELSERILEGLRDLNFQEVAFRIDFRKAKRCSADGYDEIEFLISTNPGEPVRPLAKVVSGGELSRIMLAIKALLADRDDTETLIFDEIDTGISGRTAQKVSEKMAAIGRSRQVICITHLAQIAAMADTHFEIRKEVENQETVTKIRQLSGEESVEELARILGGAEITRAVYENAREMKELALRLKGGPAA
jgi:DNA repair protein RecN (Recombination protein N)